jgi:hypothetical protein
VVEGNGKSSGVVKLALEAGDDWRIRNRTFEDVEIVGPAVCAMISGVSLDGCTFEESAEMVFWEAPDHGVIGLVGLESCTFRNCRFRGVAFLGVAEDVQEWRASVS